MLGINNVLLLYDKVYPMHILLIMLDYYNTIHYDSNCRSNKQSILGKDLIVRSWGTWSDLYVDMFADPDPRTPV